MLSICENFLAVEFVWVHKIIELGRRSSAMTKWTVVQQMHFGVLLHLFKAVLQLSPKWLVKGSLMKAPPTILHTGRLFALCKDAWKCRWDSQSADTPSLSQHLAGHLHCQLTCLLDDVRVTCISGQDGERKSGEGIQYFVFLHRTH